MRCMLIFPLGSGSNHFFLLSWRRICLGRIHFLTRGSACPGRPRAARAGLECTAVSCLTIEMLGLQREPPSLTLFFLNVFWGVVNDSDKAEST